MELSGDEQRAQLLAQGNVLVCGGEGAAAGEVAPAAPHSLQLRHPGVILSSFPSPRRGGHSQWAVCVLSPASVQGRNCRDLWGGSNAPSYNKFPLHWKLFPRISLFQSLSLWALCFLFTFKWPFVWACLVYFQYSKIHTDGSQRKIKPCILCNLVLSLLSSSGCLCSGNRAKFKP